MRHLSFRGISNTWRPNPNCLIDLDLPIIFRPYLIFEPMFLGGQICKPENDAKCFGRIWYWSAANSYLYVLRCTRTTKNHAKNVASWTGEGGEGWMTEMSGSPIDDSWSSKWTALRGQNSNLHRNEKITTRKLEQIWTGTVYRFEFLFQKNLATWNGRNNTNNTRHGFISIFVTTSKMCFISKSQCQVPFLFFSSSPTKRWRSLAMVSPAITKFFACFPECIEVYRYTKQKSSMSCPSISNLLIETISLHRFLHGRGFVRVSTIPAFIKKHVIHWTFIPLLEINLQEELCWNYIRSSKIPLNFIQTSNKTPIKENKQNKSANNILRRGFGESVHLGRLTGLRPQ